MHSSKRHMRRVNPKTTRYDARITDTKERRAEHPSSRTNCTKAARESARNARITPHSLKTWPSMSTRLDTYLLQGCLEKIALSDDTALCTSILSSSVNSRSREYKLYCNNCDQSASYNSKKAVTARGYCRYCLGILLFKAQFENLIFSAIYIPNHTWTTQLIIWI